MRSRKLLACIVALSTLANAEIKLPHGSNPCLAGPDYFKNSDSVYILIRQSSELPRTDSAYLAAMAIQCPGCILDVVGKKMIANINSSEAATDSAGLPIRIEQKMSMPTGENKDQRSFLGYDAQGRFVRQINLSLSKGTYDTTDWVWNGGCADEVRARSRTRWTADAQGHCAVGTIESKTGSDWVVIDTAKLLWNGDVLQTGILIHSTGDTTDRLEYVFDAASHPTSTTGYTKSSSGWYRSSYAEYGYSGGAFSHSVENDFSATGEVGFTTVTSLHQADLEGLATTSVRRRTVASPALRRTETGWSISNPTDESMIVRLVDPRGRSVKTIRVAAGTSATMDRPSQRSVLLWIVSTPSGRSSGTILP